jgi:hypothetical protein
MPEEEAIEENEQLRQHSQKKLAEETLLSLSD